MRIRVSTTLRGALDKMSAPVVAWLIDKGWLASWPLEITRLGKRYVQVTFRGRA